jgi:murein DD-endopeptidase MepM/ murein hydrolase activator NlpD
MNIMFLSKCYDRAHCVSLGPTGVITMLVLVLMVLPLGGMYAGYKLGLTFAEPRDLSRAWAQEMESQRQEITEAKRVAQDNLNALALRMGQMQAHVMRLDALGERLTRMAKLNDGEFDFSRSPAQGGPSAASGDTATQPLQVSDFVNLMEQLAKQLDDRGRQLDVLETMLINRNLQAEVLPNGRPIESGWISSYFGVRADPFTGRPEHHAGIDLAGKEGSNVVAVASGVVTWAGDRFGYGQLVEINHGNGYVTRYGHNQEVLVRIGQPVKKGQVLAHMGSTGRSTGPHVHFEVWRDGRPVDPMRYVQASN